MRKPEARISHKPSNTISRGPGMVSNLDDDDVRPLPAKADRRFQPQIAQATAGMGAMNGYDKIENEHGLTQLDSEEGALAALRAYAEPGVVFDVDKLIVAAAAYKFHTQN